MSICGLMGMPCCVVKKSDVLTGTQMYLVGNVCVSVSASFRLVPTVVQTARLFVLRYTSVQFRPLLGMDRHGSLLCLLVISKSRHRPSELLSDFEGTMVFWMRG